MFKRMLLSVIGSIALLGGALIASAQEKAPSPEKKHDQPSVKYEAEEGLPKDKAGEKRRDYAALEAALNDLASRQNAEYKERFQKAGPPREIVIDHKTCESTLFIDLDDEFHDIDNEDPRRIPADIQWEVQWRHCKLWE